MQNIRQRAQNFLEKNEYHYVLKQINDRIAHSFYFLTKIHWHLIWKWKRDVYTQLFENTKEIGYMFKLVWYQVKGTFCTEICIGILFVLIT